MNHVPYSLEEYLLFGVVIALCLALIIYFAWKGTSDLTDFVWGGESIGLFPVSMSLIATHVTGITVMYSTEIYQYGVNVCFEIIPIVICAILVRLQIPKLHKLKLVSLNEYIEMKFGSQVKLYIIPLLYISQIINTMTGAYSIAIFIGQVSGVGDYKCFLIVMFSCFILSSLGGFKGVVWTDACFAIAIFISSTAIIVISMGEAGGFFHVLDAAYKGDRLTVDWDPNPATRSTFWSMAVGCMGTWIALGTLFNPTIYQRYAALPVEKAKMAVSIHFTFVCAFKLFSFLCGYTIYALYEGCDPVLSGRIKKYDEILGYFVQQFGRNVPFLRSFFIICNISAAVSTLSTVMSTFSVTFYKDILQKKFNRREKDRRGKRLIQLVGLLMTFVCIGLIAILGDSGTILELAVVSIFPLSLYSAVLFMGMCMPRISSKAALLGTGVSLALGLWMIVGSRAAVKQGLIVYQLKPMRTDECPANLTITTPSLDINAREPPFYLYRISPYSQNLIGFLLVVLVATAVSFFNKGHLQDENSLTKTNVKIPEIVPLNIMTSRGK